MELTVRNAFSPNLVLQPRTFVALGVIASEADNTTVEFDRLLSQVLISLYAHLTIYDDESPAVLLSIIACLTDLLAGMGAGEQPLSESRTVFLLSIFWVAVGLVQLADSQIFMVALNLITQTLRILESKGAFLDYGMSPTLALHRESRFADQATALDASYGVWFSADFSFAFSAHMMRGLKQPSTKQAAMEALMTVLEIAGRSYVQMRGNPNPAMDYVNDHCIGFVIPLLPIQKSIHSVFRMSGLPDHLTEMDLEHVSIIPGTLENGGSKYRQILDRLTPLSDENRAMLMISLLVTLLEGHDISDSEAAFIYGMLAEITLESPELMSMV
jgi:neurofibromin 1